MAPEAVSLIIACLTFVGTITGVVYGALRFSAGREDKFTERLMRNNKDLHAEIDVLRTRIRNLEQDAAYYKDHIKTLEARLGVLPVPRPRKRKPAQKAVKARSPARNP